VNIDFTFCQSWASTGRWNQFVKLFQFATIINPSFPIDFGCEDSRCLVSESWVAISNPDFLSSSETGVNPVMRSWKSTFWMSSMSEGLCWNLFHKEEKSWDSTTWFRIWQFQTPA
jgi:hypothetical protein